MELITHPVIIVAMLLLVIAVIWHYSSSLYKAYYFKEPPCADPLWTSETFDKSSGQYTGIDDYIPCYRARALEWKMWQNFYTSEINKKALRAYKSPYVRALMEGTMPKIDREKNKAAARKVLEAMGDYFAQWPVDSYPAGTGTIWGNVQNAYNDLVASRSPAPAPRCTTSCTIFYDPAYNECLHCSSSLQATEYAAAVNKFRGVV